MKITVMSTFDIDPANDGGRRRYQAMLGELSKRHDVTLVGYHLGSFPGIRSYRLNPRFQVHVASTSTDDTKHCWFDHGRTQRIAHDVLCIKTYWFTEDFLKLCAAHVGAADVVVVAHPYLIMPVLRYRRAGAVQVYESYNVEYDAKCRHFAGIDPDLRTRHLTDVVYAERLACQTSHYVTAVSADDARRLEALYDLAPDTVRVSPNGVDTGAYPRLGAQDKAAFRARLGIPEGTDVAVFVGSAYGPNVESYREARAMLQAAGFRGCVVLVGSIAQADRTEWMPVSFREIWLGYVSDEVRTVVLGCSDFALQFITTGAGTNLKVFDYMASQTLIVANAFGARGIAEEGWCIRCETSDELRGFLRGRSWTTDEGERIAARARSIAERTFDWRVIGDQFDALLCGRGQPGGAAMYRLDKKPPERGRVDRFPRVV